MIIQRLWKKPPAPAPVVNLKPQISYANPPPPLNHTWGKLRFAQWIEEIKAKFKIGDLVCSSAITPIEGNTKYYPLYYRITYIQEVNYMAEVDPTTMQPKCLGMVLPGTSTPTWRSPASVRKLTQRELENVDIRAKEESPPNPLNILV